MVDPPLTEAAKELPEIFNKQIGRIVSSPVAAAVEVVPRDDVLVVAFGKAAQRLESKAKLASPVGVVVGSFGCSACASS